MNESKIERLNYKFDYVVKLRFNKSFASLDELGVHPGQCHMITFLNKFPGKSQKELADLLRIKPATMTIMIKKMEKAELVERIPDEIDQRVLRVNLTKKGQELFEKLDKINKKMQKEFYQDFTEEEIDTFYKLLDKMETNISGPSDDAIRKFMENHMKCL